MIPLDGPGQSRSGKPKTTKSVLISTIRTKARPVLSRFMIETQKYAHPGRLETAIRQPERRSNPHRGSSDYVGLTTIPRADLYIFVHSSFANLIT
jgi:hypothetical protein